MVGEHLYAGVWQQQPAHWGVHSSVAQGPLGICNDIVPLGQTAAVGGVSQLPSGTL